jgi:uncharacterized protein (DUF427 family)
MTNRQMKLPGPDHPISIDSNPSRVVVTVGGKVIADTRSDPFIPFHRKKAHKHLWLIPLEG